MEVCMPYECIHHYGPLYSTYSIGYNTYSICCTTYSICCITYSICCVTYSMLCYIQPMLSHIQPMLRHIQPMLRHIQHMLHHIQLPPHVGASDSHIVLFTLFVYMHAALQMVLLHTKWSSEHTQTHSKNAKRTSTLTSAGSYLGKYQTQTSLLTLH